MSASAAIADSPRSRVNGERDRQDVRDRRDSKFRKPRTADLELSPVSLVPLFSQLSRVLGEYFGLTFCKVVSGRCWRRSGVANDLAFHEIDHQLGDVGGMIGNPFEIFGNEA